MSPTISVDDFLKQARNSLGICLSLDEGHEPEIRKNSFTCIQFAKPLHMPFITASLSICKGIFSICDHAQCSFISAACAGQR